MRMFRAAASGAGDRILRMVHDQKAIFPEPGVEFRDLRVELFKRIDVLQIADSRPGDVHRGALQNRHAEDRIKGCMGPDRFGIRLEKHAAGK